jgi:hypothetical protein
MPGFPRIPGYALSSEPTLASEWAAPACAYPGDLWPDELLRRVRPDPSDWLIVEEHFYRDDQYGGTHSIMIEPTAREAVLGDTRWSGHHSVGSVEVWADGRFTDGLVAGPNPVQPSMHFFTAVREHHRLVDPSFEITPVFLWYWDAFQTARGWSYLNAAGRDVELIRTTMGAESWMVEIAALELRTFLAEAGRELLVQMDYTTLKEHPSFDRVDHRFHSEGARFDWFALHDDSIGGHPAFSNLMGKYVIAGSITSHRRRIDERTEPKKYGEYIYGLDSETGHPLTHTSDPSRLGDFRDSTRLPGLTPVYFSREVLARYTAEPRRYSLSSSRLACLDLWGLDISTNTAGLIEVYLEEIGSLPTGEQAHWLAHNVLPAGEMDEGRFRRDFLNQIVASPDPQGDLRRCRTRAADATRVLLGAAVWRSLDAQTSAEFEHLYGPTSTDPSALTAPILTLTKALVDGIDSSPLKAFLGGAEAGEESLRLLDRFVQKIGGSADCVEPFRALQKFRSTGGIAHLGGSSAEAARSRLGIEGLAPFPAFVVVVEQLTVALERIAELVEGVANEAK